MSKKMLINASHPEENRVAIVVDGVLNDLDIEIAGQQQTKGNIYKAVVARVEPGLQAAFVDYGAERHGFLQTGEIHPSLHPAKKSDSKAYPRINEILHRGQEILVQVVKGERGTKGAALTTFLSLPGRYMVLMPDSSTKGVSRKIQDDKERKTLKKTMAQLDLPDEMGYIVRTAGIGKEEAELKRDFNYLVSLYQGILKRKETVKAPAQLYQESDIVIRSIRDYFSTEMDEVLIDDSEVYRQARDFFSLVMPDQLKLVKQHREKRPIFSRYQIEEQIESLARNQVPLPSGGSIVIDQTEALVAIDVNSGRMAGEKGIEATAARSNIEAAAEIGRQLRLRDLGGLIVIDFIDMRDRKKVHEVEQTLKASVKNDKARISTGRISQFGLLELSRQRIRPTLSVGAYLPCPHCQGKGQIKSPEAQAVALLRQLHAAVSKGQIGTIKAIIPLNVANYLHNEKRQSLSDLEKRFDLSIQIYGSVDAIPEEIELDLIKREKAHAQTDEQAPVSHAEGLEQALAAANAPETEKPAESDEEETTDRVAPTEEATEAPSGKRKRRRRRRRRSTPAEAQLTTEQNQQTAGEPSAESLADTEKTEHAPQSSQAVAAQTVQSAETSTVEKPETDPAATPEAATSAEDKPKRRGRGRGRKPAAKKVEESPTEASTEATASAKEATTEVSPEIATPAEEKPKRRGRRPAAKKTEEVATEAATEIAAPAEEKPKTRGRKPAAKKDAESLTEASTEVATPTEEKPKRRTRKPAAKKVAETPAETAAEATPAEEKPKRRTRKPAAKKVAETPVETATEATPAEEKPKRRTRKPAAKKVAETPVETAAEATPAEEKPKRRTRKPAAKKVAEAPVETTAEATPAEEKPKRRTRKPAAKKVAEAPVETATEATPAEEKPKQRTRKPAAKKTTEPTTDVSADAAAPAAEKPKRRPRKPAVKKTVD